MLKKMLVVLAALAFSAPAFADRGRHPVHGYGHGHGHRVKHHVVHHRVVRRDVIRHHHYRHHYRRYPVRHVTVVHQPRPFYYRSRHSHHGAGIVFGAVLGAVIGHHIATH